MKDTIVRILIGELDYSDYVASLTADDLLSLHPKLQPALRAWLDNRSVANIEAEQISIKMLMEQRGYTFPSALISMDWLLTEPEIAKAELTNEVRR